MYSIIGGIVIVLSAGIWIFSSSIIEKTTPSSSSSELVEKELPMEEWYPKVSLLEKDTNLKDYSDRVGDYRSSIESFNSFYGLLDIDLESLSVYSSSSFNVVVTATGGVDYYVLNPNGSVVGYFSKDFTPEKAKVFGGFTLVRDKKKQILGVYSENTSSDVDYSAVEDSTTEMGYQLEKYPINTEFVKDLDSYSPAGNVTFELSDSRTPVKYRAYSNSNKDVILVNKDNIIVGMKSSVAWKTEVFRRSGSGTIVEIMGEKLWVY